MDYYSPFWGPEAIFLVGELQGELTCMTLTLTVLADSGPFRGLLLTVLGSGAIFLVDEPQCALTCMTLTLAVLAYSGLFLWTTSHRFRVPGDFYSC